MPYTLEDFRREYISGLSPEERVSGLSPEERVRGLSPEERMEGLSDSEIEEILQRRKQAAARNRPRKKK